MLESLTHLNITQWVAALGYPGMMIIIFLEMGMFFGFFLPGDSLVFAAGLLASKGIFEMKILIPLFVVTALIGYTIGYWFGDKLGHWLMRRNDSIIFKKAYITQAHKFYEKHGGKALVLGRLVPIVRTFVPIVAGMGKMDYKKFFFYNLFGALVWGGLIPTLGYYIGGILPDAAEFILLFVLIVIFISILPGIWHYIKYLKNRA